MISGLKNGLASLYRRSIRPLLNPLQQQRFKLLWTAWGYRPILSIGTLTLRQRLRLLRHVLGVDWKVLHGHWPGEIARVLATIGEREAKPGEVVVEAGCWQGGSTIKFSWLCRALGYQLLVFDSFEGVEHIPGNDFSGEYAATLAQVRENVSRYGEISVCTFFPGWFAETLAAEPLQVPVQVVYLDCDLAKGTEEVLRGVAATLTTDAAICTQDYHIEEVRVLLDDPGTWNDLGRTLPQVTDEYRNLAILR